MTVDLSDAGILRLRELVQWAINELAPDMDVPGCRCSWCHTDLTVEKSTDDFYRFVGHAPACPWDNFRMAMLAFLDALERGGIQP